MKRIALLTFLVWLGAIITGCVIMPITDGFHHELPKPAHRLVVWGAEPNAVGTATSWLLKRGYRVVERAKLDQVLEEQRIQLTHTPEDEAHVLGVGKLIGAQMVVFVVTKITSQEAGSAVYNLGMTIRGVDVETGEVQWVGTGRYPKPASNIEDGIVKLTCHVLATAWGLESTGEQTVDDVCRI